MVAKPINTKTDQNEPDPKNQKAVLVRRFLVTYCPICCIGTVVLGNLLSQAIRKLV